MSTMMSTMMSKLYIEYFIRKEKQKKMKHDILVLVDSDYRIQEVYELPQIVKQHDTAHFAFYKTVSKDTIYLTVSLPQLDECDSEWDILPSIHVEYEQMDVEGECAFKFEECNGTGINGYWAEFDPDEIADDE